MPAEGKPLMPEEIADLTTWIKDGAAWPAVKVPASIGKKRADYEKLKREHWAWQPLDQSEAARASRMRRGRVTISTASFWRSSKRRICIRSAMPIERRCFGD